MRLEKTTAYERDIFCNGCGYPFTRHEECYESEGGDVFCSVTCSQEPRRQGRWQLDELLKRAITEQSGTLTTQDLAKLARIDRLRMVLVRCGCGIYTGDVVFRFQTPAQDAGHFIGMVNSDKLDYVRDVSIPATDPAWTQFGDGLESAITPSGGTKV